MNAMSRVGSNGELEMRLNLAAFVSPAAASGERQRETGYM